MSSFNEILIVGYAGKDPDIKTFSNGDKVANFSIATTDRWTDAAGQQQEHTEWHSCVAYRRIAQVASDFLKKGSLVLIKGRMKTRSWDNKEGAKQYKTDVEVMKLLVLDRMKDLSEPSFPSDTPF